MYQLPKQGSHRSDRCMSAPCSKCGKKHHNLLHSDALLIRPQPITGLSRPSANKALRESTNATLDQYPSTSFMAVPVQLVNKGRILCGMALLDPASFGYLRFRGSCLGTPTLWGDPRSGYISCRRKRNPRQAQKSSCNCQLKLFKG